MKKYGFNIFWSEEVAGFVASCPDFPALSVSGPTIEASLRLANGALAEMVVDFQRKGVRLPEPTVLLNISGEAVRLPGPPLLEPEAPEQVHTCRTSGAIGLVARKVQTNLAQEQVEFVEQVAAREGCAFTDILSRAIDAERFFIEKKESGLRVFVESDDHHIHEVLRG